MLLKIFLLIVAYLIGSISSAIIVAKLFNLPDPRTSGSKNPGATNILRIAGKNMAAIVLFSDLLKGYIPTFLAVYLNLSPFWIGCTAIAAVLGHIYPLFYEFKGGKGVATSIGCYLGISLILGILVAITWALVAKIYRYSSLAAIVAVSIAPFFALFMHHGFAYFVTLLVISIMVLTKHQENIERLRAHSEPKIGDKG